MKLGKIFSNEYFMSMNFRNKSLIRKLNSEDSIALVDDKLRFKTHLIENGIMTPKILCTITSMQEFSKLEETVAPFVLKPVKGHGGYGIVVITRKEGKSYIDSNGKSWSEYQLRRHAMRILDGAFSIGGRFDTILVEEKIRVPMYIKEMFPLGVPDIRIILHHHKPILAMMRVPTEKSGGKANLSQGANALNVDLFTGKVQGYYSADARSQAKVLPKFNLILPRWDEIIGIAIHAAACSGLGYCGVDIVYDQKGPMVLECNARPGLEIQNVTSRNIAGIISENKDSGNFREMIEQARSSCRTHKESKNLKGSKNIVAS